MTKLLQLAIDEVRKLTDEEQDAIAHLILDELADDQKWDRAFKGSQQALARLAEEAREDVAAGRVRSLERRSP